MTDKETKRARREERLYRLQLLDEEWRGREKDAELARGPYAGD